MQRVLRVLGCVFLLACQSAGEAAGLSFDPSELEVSVPRGLVQTFDVATGEVDSTFSVSKGSEWLSVASDTGVARVTVDASELDEGQSVGEIRATRAGYKAAVLPVRLTVTPQESVAVSLSSVLADVPEGASEALALTFSLNTGHAEIALSTSGTWLSLDVTRGTDPLGTTVRFDASQLAQGDHTASIVATAPGYAATIVPVMLTVSKPAIRFVTPDLAFTIAQAATGAQQLGIVATKGSGTFSISSPSWLSVTTDETVTPATASINLNSEGMTQVENGVTKTGTVTITPVSSVYVGEPLSVTVTWVAPRYVALVATGQSRLDVGYTGNAHNVRFPTGTLFTAAVQCGTGFSQDCQLTDIAPHSVVSGRPNNRRCLESPWLSCTQDTDCTAGSSDACVYFVSAPIPVSAVGSAACAMLHYLAPLSGTINLGSGMLSLGDVEVRAGVFTLQHIRSQCPQCVSGVCDGGEREGQPCTVWGTHEFATSGVSLDCPPYAGASLTRTWDLRIPAWSATTTTSEHELSIVAGSPSCDGSTCVCGACSLNSTIACQTNADCPVGAGTCSASDAAPNSCGAYTECTQTTATLDGVCSLGPTFDVFCSAWTNVPCQDDLDCSDTDPSAGTCSLGVLRPCFYNLGAGSGTLRSENKVYSRDDVRLGTSFCAPRTFRDISNVAGLPGPVRLQIRGATQIIY